VEHQSSRSYALFALPKEVTWREAQRKLLGEDEYKRLKRERKD